MGKHNPKRQFPKDLEENVISFVVHPTEYVITDDIYSTYWESNRIWDNHC